jgi:alpha-tubulin suppressor-like RCC1 family protein/uncharacterized lipoprotein NlpE involved in copper resistance
LLSSHVKKKTGEWQMKRMKRFSLSILMVFCLILSGLSPFSIMITHASSIQVQNIAAGMQHSVATKEDGTVWTWGFNNYGQLGDGTKLSKKVRVQVQGLNGVISIASGLYHSLALKNDGTVWAWGNNSTGKLGDGTSTNKVTPVQVSGLNNVISITSQSNHSLALKSDGTVWAWGQNSYGKLGDGTLLTRNRPVQVNGLSNIISISAGTNHSVAVREDGTVWTWGYNKYGQLGDGTTTNRLTPIEVMGLNDIIEVSAGYFHTVALKKDGTVWAWGNNSLGKLGDGTTTNRTTPVKVQGINNVIMIEAGDNHTLGLTSLGDVWSWGQNNYGKLGDGTTTYRKVPVQVKNLTDVSSISGGTNHSLAIKNDGTVWAWGQNSYSKLGDGTITNSKIPIQVKGLLVNAPNPVIEEDSNPVVDDTGTIEEPEEPIEEPGEEPIEEPGEEPTTDPSDPSDVTAPVTISNVSEGWSNQNLFVQLSASDELSGVAKTFYSINGSQLTEGTTPTIIQEGSNILSFYSVDNAGNNEEVKTVEVKIDKTSPETNFVISDQLNNKELTLNLTALDTFSGVAKTFYSVNGSEFVEGNTFSISADGNNKVSFYSVDNAGNIEELKTEEVLLDKKAPETVSDISNKWNKGDMSITLTATDDLSGVANTFFSLNGSEFSEGTTFNVNKEGNNKVIFYSVDNAGNVEEFNTKELKIDSTPPLTVSNVEEKWSNGEFRVELTPADYLSGVAKTFYSVNGSEFVEGTMFVIEADIISKVSFYSVDNAGNVEDFKTVEVKIDNTAPVTASDISDTWNKGDVTVTLTASDDLSGVEKSFYSVNGSDFAEATTFTVTKEGINNVSFYSVDNAGNVEEVKTAKVNIDNTAPETTSDITDKWNKGDVTVTLTTSDDLSGVVESFYSINGSDFSEGTTFTVTKEGINNVSFYSVDKAGNVEQVKTAQVKMDNTAPETTSEITDTWNKGDVTVTLTATDDLSGVAKTFYSVNGSDFVEGTTFTVTKEGVNKVSFHSVDNVGNVEEVKTAIVKIDNTAPETTTDITDKWNKGDVTPTLKSADNLSGGAKTFYSVNGSEFVEGTTFTLSKEGINKVSFYSVDNAGNNEEVQTVEVKIDKTAPVVTWDLADQLALGSSLPFAYKASDEHSGIATETISVNGRFYENTESVKLDKPGTYVVVVTVTDHAGWTTILEKTIEVYIPAALVVNPGVIKANAGDFTVKISLPSGYNTSLVDLSTAKLNGVSAKSGTNGLVQQAKNGQFKFNRDDFEWKKGMVTVEFRVLVNGILVFGSTTVEVK